MSWADHRPEAIQWYWDSVADPSRARFLDVLERYVPFTSILELGCHCGPVRKAMRARFGQDWSYVGVDVNAQAIDAAREYARGTDLRSSFIPGDMASALDVFEDDAFDLVISCSTLMCVSPSELEPVLASAKRLARRAVIVQEDVGHGEWVDGRGWAHEYPDWIIHA